MKNHKCTKATLAVLLLCGMCFGLTSCGDKKRAVSARETVWYEENPVVCHALGKTEEGDIYTNSLEALEYNYGLGQRVFEADLSVTADEVIVLRHDWDSDLGQSGAFGWTEEKKEIPDADTFLNTKIFDKYTPMSFTVLLAYMSEQEDMYVVLDSKYTNDVSSQYHLIVDTAVDNGYKEVLNRIIPQLYYPDMYEEVNEIYAFSEYILTLYYIGYTDGDELGSACEKKGISVLVMPSTWYGLSVYEELAEYPLKIYVHTVNDIEEAERMLECNAAGIYSDELLPSQLRKE